MLRRSFLGGTALSPFLLKTADAASKAVITKIETTWWPDRNKAPFWPHWTWVRLHTDAGVFGLGETYPRNEVEAAAIHALGRPLLGKPLGSIERFWRDTFHTLDFQIAGGAEVRALSALDLALWDLLGKLTGQPVWRLIGGQTNPRVRLYNTCFPYKYNFLTEPQKIMRELIDTHGIHAIKIWPFDGAARETGGQYVSQQQIDAALRPVRLLRDNFGDSIEILIEFHALWNVTSAARIARAMEPYRPMWLEDMLMPGHFQQYRQLAESTPLPLTIGERMAGKLQFQSMLESKAARYIMFDVCWCGGLTEARKITTMADAYQLPFAPHTAGGPLLFYASTHLSTAMPNVAIQESCQRFYESDWPKMLVSPWMPSEGTVQASDAPGFGMEVRSEVWQHPAAVHRSSAL
jgi:L-alanine-DL-glutamate epimerase-like enolase superfamily enzyme